MGLVGSCVANVNVCPGREELGNPPTKHFGFRLLRFREAVRGRRAQLRLVDRSLPPARPLASNDRVQGNSGLGMAQRVWRVERSGS